MLGRGGGFSFWFSHPQNWISWMTFCPSQKMATSPLWGDPAHFYMELPFNRQSFVLFSVWTEHCKVMRSDGFFLMLSKMTSCSPWVFWIACNAVFHMMWVGTLLACQLYQVRPSLDYSKLLLYSQQNVEVAQRSSLPHIEFKNGIWIELGKTYFWYVAIGRIISPTPPQVYHILKFIWKSSHMKSFAYRLYRKYIPIFEILVVLLFPFSIRHLRYCEGSSHNVTRTQHKLRWSYILFYIRYVHPCNNKKTKN